MNTKRKIQITVDVLMTAVLLLLMSYSIAGELIHEILGISMFVLLAAHHILSFSYTKALFKGRRSADKTLKIIVDILLSAAMLVQLLSAVSLSKYIFAFLGAQSLSAAGRTLHLLGAYWCFDFIGLHLGFHLDIMLNKPMKDKKKRIITLCILAALFTAGVIMFIKEGIYRYMFLIQQFVFFDTSHGLALFLVKYILIMCMYAVIGYSVIKIIKKGRLI